MKKIVSLVTALVLTLSLAGCGTSSDNKTVDSKDAKEAYTIVTVPKLTSIAWFQRMEEGVKKYASDSGMDAYYTGPATGDAALQAQVIEDLIAKKVDAICVVPFSTEALEPVLKKAKDAGILVITHEAAGMTNIDYDIEAFDNDAYGEHFMEKIGELTGGEGQYIQEVGALTSQSHKQWTDAASALQQTKFPKMKMFGDKIETKDDQSISYDKVKEAIKANPDIAAIQGSAMGDVAGAALAVEESGLSGKIKVVGTSLVSVSGKYVKSGTIDMISFWDPADAGYAMNVLAEKILSGETVADGIDLGVSGYEKLTLDGKVLTGEAWVDVDKNNVDDPALNF
ncbi:autoinducer 2 ABC transporter substrate-binding protein [Clostridium sediminicola]|uniref:autoinducer 2 ABC transporter substrate-binding protein n=1 Tax=Clostridium sediminicola TaxID=3114879 RepID=UPI0031F21249